ncbi:MAG: hypothetical protein FWF70_00400 [Bacteroidetes bacterium]|nr:hypothetical protein [Bacteroidota bacterium]MCL1969624.1 hypothetical protein [Bacteroidota bacterium]
MIKKVVYYTALWVANILLLVHIALPHHHHGETKICFFNSCCKDSEEEHHHEQDEVPSSGKCCTIDNIYFSTTNDTKIARCDHENCSCGQWLHAVVPTVLNTCSFVENPATHFREKPYIPLFYAAFVSQSVGLRAPPVC